MRAYYNEHDPFAAAWLRELITDNLIAPGDVDERSIADVQPADLAGYTQCHFFAGIGGWSLALRLAGWPDDRPAWTGSCPCQPFSTAGKERGIEDKRHLWPVWYRLIQESRPPIIFGEQVASPLAEQWLDGVAENLEAKNYAVGAVILPATCVGAPHRRDRFYFVADSGCTGATGGCSIERRRESGQEMARPWAFQNWQGGNSHHGRVDDGISSRLAKSIAGGYGNAIVPQVAAAFISASTEALAELDTQP